MTNVILQVRGLDPDTHKRGTPHEDEGSDWVMLPPDKEHQRFLESH